MLCAVIMAGGKGTRFWPLSTEEKPKQFLSLISNETMIQKTIRRLEPLIPIERVFVVTGKKYWGLVKKQLPELPERNIILEPVGKNTAPCIALSAFIINKYFKNATLAVLPADHLIRNEKKFKDTLKAAEKFIEGKSDAIVTLGMRPDRAETGYGYINYNCNSFSIDKFKIHEVNKFIEKPKKEIAEKFLAEGNYLWNGGMFIWKTSTILELSEKYINSTYNVLKEVAATSNEDFQNVLDKRYLEVDSISVDCGIMENAKSIYVIPSEFGWDDIGTWKAVERYRSKDERNNVLIGQVTSIDGKNNIVVAKDKSIILAGLNDIFVVESDGVILIGNKEFMEEVKSIKKLHEHI